jgi:CubicO group peptidase (beta-lactamase class C family)
MFHRLALLLLLFLLPAQAQTLDKEKILEAMPEYEAYVEQARLDWGVPSVAVAVIHNDEIVWWKGFGDEPPDLNTVFAIGSTTKAFAAATLAIMVDDGGPGWDAKVVDHLPGFAMYDPWVTREMQVDDLLAQHTGLRPQALSALGSMGYSAEQIIRALRWSEPVTSFRSSYAYVNTPHLVAGELVANWAGVDNWEQVLSERLLEPLGMETTTWTAEGLDGNSNSAPGHARVDDEVRQIAAGPFPYVFGPAGALNSNLHDMSRWVRLQLGNGEFEGKRLISEENLLVTRSPHTILSRGFYCMGWLITATNGGVITWHNGGTPGHTTFVGLQPEEGLGVVVLSNLGGTQMPDAVGIRLFEAVKGIDGPDYNKMFLENRKEPDYPKILADGFLPEMTGNYHHPALGTFEVDEQRGLTSMTTDFGAVLEPIGPNLFQITAKPGWLKDVGWSRVGEALYSPAGISEPASFTLFLGEPDEGTAFKAERVKD